MAFRIYTKTGDKGETSLIGGVRVPKHHIRIEAYGTVDELNSHIGLIIDTYTQKEKSKTLYEIQDRLFVIGSYLASAEKSKMQIPQLQESDIELLEKEIDRMGDALPALKNFILPSGTVLASHCHVARCVCRRAERITVHLATEAEVNNMVIRYLNRLSDYLFTLARFMVHEAGAEEIVWQTR